MGVYNSLTTAVFTVALTSSVLSGCVSDGAIRGGGTATVYDDRSRVSIAFTTRDRELIRHYYRRNLPPGLEKREQLPPGLQKQLVRRGSLPPGLQSHRLPGDLDRQLSRLPTGYVRLRVASEVLLIDERTRVILDVVSDIGR